MEGRIIVDPKQSAVKTIAPRTGGHHRNELCKTKDKWLYKTPPHDLSITHECIMQLLVHDNSAQYTAYVICLVATNSFELQEYCRINQHIYIYIYMPVAPVA